MADKKYKLNFELSNGSTQSIEFTVPQGEKGIDGASAYDHAKTGGYTGTETEFNELLAKIADVMPQITTYSVTTNLTGVTGASSNPTTISYGESVELTFTTNTGYTLPDTISVTGATSDWNKSTGKLTLSDPTGDVTIIIAAKKIFYYVTTDLTGVTGVSSNPTTISYGGTASLTFIADEGYKLPDVITVVGATYTWDPKLGLLSLSNPTGNVSVAITGVEFENYIRFLSADPYFTLEATNVEWDGTVEYSFDKSTWSVWDGTTISASLNVIYMRGSGNTRFYTSGGLQLKLSEFTSCYGNINVLLDHRNPPSELTTMDCFRSMFENCVNLINAPELPATTLSPSCYQQMFSGCTNLTQPPVLPATNLSPYCYYQMFSGCTNLTHSPELPATNLKNFCYQRMFSGCTSLTQAPKLSAKTLSKYCYYQMFSGCTSLTQTPELPATNLGIMCYYGMFSGCTNLSQPPKLSATTLKSNCYASMFNGCTGIKLSTTKTGDYQTAYRIPTSGTGIGNAATDAMLYMFSGTGGTFTGTPSINTTYYGAWSNS